MLALVAVLYSATAITAVAQDSSPSVGGKPLVQVKPHAKRAPASTKQQSVETRLQACLEIDDETKGRLDCYDAVYPPKPNPKAPAAKVVAECRFTKEQDERLTCFNAFVEAMPKLPQ
jgi:hypothetical protein